MRQLACLLYLLLAAPTFAQTSVPEIPYDAPADYFTYPAAMNLGEITGVAVNSRGHVFMVSRSNATGNVYGGLATQLFEFDERGRFVREIGHGLYGFAFGHAVRIDPQDNIWVVDKGTNMVIRFNPAGRVTMVLGRREEATDEHVYVKRPQAKPVDGMFNEPTDVAWDRAGNIYITDGYVNSRVAKFDSSGAWVKSWGSHGYQPGQFDVPHNVAVDASGRVYVADRTNGRLQVFNGDGTFVKEIVIRVPAPPGTQPLLGYQAPPAADAPAGSVFTYRPGSPAAICIPPGPDTKIMYVADLYPGRIYKLTLDGEVLGMLGKSGKLAGQFGGLHGLACPSENVLYTAEFINWRSQKLMLHPERAAPRTGSR
jgi:DNA-binding beta-propeller fold protein YncE